MSVSSAASGMLQHDPFQRIGDILAAIGGDLQVGVKLAPADGLDQRGDVGRLVVEYGERVVEDVVGLVFEKLIPLRWCVDRASAKARRRTRVFRIAGRPHHGGRVCVVAKLAKERSV